MRHRTAHSTRLVHGPTPRLIWRLAILLKAGLATGLLGLTLSAQEPPPGEPAMDPAGQPKGKQQQAKAPMGEPAGAVMGEPMQMGENPEGMMEPGGMMEPEGMMAKPKPEPVPEPPKAIAVDYSEIKFGTYTISNRDPGQPGERRVNCPETAWNSYMHGVVDFFATPVSWAAMSGDKAPADLLDEDAVLKSPLKTCTMPAIRMPGGKSHTFPKPLPIDLKMHRGQTIRVFFWIKAEDTGQGADAWSGPPGVDLMRYDLAGNLAATAASTVKTRGSFPWHCYYRDIYIPMALDAVIVEPPPLPVAETELTFEDVAGDAAAGAEAAAAEEEVYRSVGIYLRVSNPASGIAWFSTVSWEVVRGQNSYSMNEKQDPITGSLAPNPRYDELPFHMCWGMGRLHTWNFLKGAAGGAENVPNLTRNSTLAAYIKQDAIRDPVHLLHGVSLLGPWAREGEIFGLLPPLEKGWFDALKTAVLATQDPATGLWGHAGSPASVALSSVYVSRLFGPERIPRSDRPVQKTPWFSIGSAGIPKAAEAVHAVLALQRVMEDKRRSGWGWPRLAYDFIPENVIGADTSLSLSGTAVASQLLARLRPHVERKDQVQIDRALQEAYEQVMAKLVLPNGLWLQNDRGTRPESPAFMPDFLDALPVLERRTVYSLRPPKVACAPVARGNFSFSLEETSANCLSVRLYAVPPRMALPNVTHQHLVGIIQKRADSIQTMDPLIAVNIMRDAARAAWNGWGAGRTEYVDWKLDSVDMAKLAVVKSGEPLNVYVPKSDSIRIFASAVNSYGEESRFLQVFFKVIEPDPGKDAVAETVAEGVPAEDANGEDKAPNEAAEDDPFAN